MTHQQIHFCSFSPENGRYLPGMPRHKQNRVIIYLDTLLLSISRAFFSDCKKYSKYEWINVKPQIILLSPHFMIKYFPFVLNANGHWFIFSHWGQLCHISWLIRMHSPLKDILTETCHIRHLHSAWFKILSAVLNSFQLAWAQQGYLEWFS